MKILLGRDLEEVSNLVVDRLIDLIQTKPNSVLGLATGKTMLPIYKKLVEKIRELNVDISRCYFFLLDEYLNLSQDNPTSFKNYIKNHFFNPLSINEDQYSIPSIENFEQYDDLILQKGGIDIQLLGLGLNGHIGFNEPGSHKHSKTRIIKLTDETLRVNGVKDINEAITMGVETILQSRKIFMIVTGDGKASTVKFLLNHHDDASCPATYLKDHSHFDIFLDSAAASKINLNI